LRRECLFSFSTAFLNAFSSRGAASADDDDADEEDDPDDAFDPDDDDLIRECPLDLDDLVLSLEDRSDDLRFFDFEEDEDDEEGVEEEAEEEEDNGREFTWVSFLPE